MRGSRVKQYRKAGLGHRRARRFFERARRSKYIKQPEPPRRTLRATTSRLTRRRRILARLIPHERSFPHRHFWFWVSLLILFLIVTYYLYEIH